jgi:hypothetical protein
MLSSLNRDRRSSIRYRVPGKAHVFWPDTRVAAATLGDVSAQGCLVLGPRVPAVGVRIFLSLEVTGLPNVRLPATAVRRSEDGLGEYAALRFDVPTSSTQGLGLLLASQLSASDRRPLVLIVDRTSRARTRIANALREGGFEVMAVESATDALNAVRQEAVDIVLARCDGSGCAALLAVARDSPTTLRVAFGRHAQVTQALGLGHAQALSDEPSSPVILHSLLAQRSTTSKNPV